RRRRVPTRDCAEAAAKCAAPEPPELPRSERRVRKHGNLKTEAVERFVEKLTHTSRKIGKSVLSRKTIGRTGLQMHSFDPGVLEACANRGTLYMDLGLPKELTLCGAPWEVGCRVWETSKEVEGKPSWVRAAPSPVYQISELIFLPPPRWHPLPRKKPGMFRGNAHQNHYSPPIPSGYPNQGRKNKPYHPDLVTWVPPPGMHCVQSHRTDPH
ncbi:hypothetical protein GH733_008070, partial [Mirounga leonina]